ncbi:MAG: ribbon-helix-helix domain-containing protein [Candidatus Hermodarchaeia archaeon]
MLKLVSTKLPKRQLEGLEELVAMQLYPNRSAAIRTAVRDLLKRELWDLAPRYSIDGERSRQVNR